MIFPVLTKERKTYVKTANRICAGYLGDFTITRDFDYIKPAKVEAQPEEVEDIESIDFTGDIDRDIVVGSRRNISWNNDKLADGDIQYYSDTLNWAKEEIDKIDGATVEDFEWYRNKLKDLFYSWIHSLSRCASANILWSCKLPQLR